jgi:EF hand
VRRIGLAWKLALTGWVVAGLVAPPVTTGQELKEPKVKKPKVEKPLRPEKPEKPTAADKLAKIAEKQAEREEKILFATAKQTFGGDTERDRWIKVMAELHPGATVPDARGEVDFARWYDAVSPGQPTWALQSIHEKPIKELFLRSAQRLGLEKGQPIPREAFLAYAVQNLSANGSPPWKAPNPEVDPFDAAAKIFNGLDRNKSGALEPAEQTDSLKSVLAQFDANGNGALEYEEYREYFRARMGGYRENPASLSAGRPQPEEKPESPLPKKEAPPSLPKWYFELDDDRDGQVGLYEWRSVGQRPLEEFAAVDRDGDGLLTPYELKCLTKAEPKSPYLKASLPSIPPRFLNRSWR